VTCISDYHQNILFLEEQIERGFVIHTQFAKWARTPVDEKRCHPEVEVVGAGTPHLLRLHSTGVNLLGILPSTANQQIPMSHGSSSAQEKLMVLV